MNQARLNFLQTLKNNDLANDVPSVSEHVAKFLHGLASSLPAKNILEIGTAHAYSTIWLADVVEKNDGQVTTIDVSTPSFEIASQNIAQCNLESTVNQHFGNAKDIIKTLNDTYDFIFIDARKKDTHIFFALCAAKLKPGGLIVVDDVEKFHEKMAPFWNLIKAQSEWEYFVLPLDQDDSLMCLQKA